MKMAKSYTQISLYERCAFAYNCRYIQKWKEPESEALKHGIETHDKIEAYIKGKRKTLNDVVHPASKKLITQTKKMKANVEEFWHFDKNWEMVSDWDWLVVKMDAYYVPEEGTLRIIDWKTGKPWPGHKEQMHLYATAGFSVYDCNAVECLSAYVDQGTSIIHRFKEDQYESMRSSWNKRIGKLENEKAWKMSPSNHCRWCSFRKSNGGPCGYG